VDLREGRKEQLAMDDGGVDSRECRAILQSDRIWEERSGGWPDKSYRCGVEVPTPVSFPAKSVEFELR
jgi:hypothetical protein